MSEIQTDKNPQNTSDNCLISNMSQQESVMANNGKETGEMDGENTIGLLEGNQEKISFQKRVNRSKKLSNTRIKFRTNYDFASAVDTVLKMHEENSPDDYSDVQHKDAMQNFRTYLALKNVNYEPVIVDKEILECPKNSTQKGCNKLHIRWLSTRFINHIIFRTVLVLLILLDVALITWALVLGSDGNSPTLMSIACTDLGISVFFIFEIGLRMFCMTPHVYFSKRYWYNILDSIFIILGFIFGIVEIVLMEQTDKKILGFGVISILRIVRAIKLVRIARIFIEHHQIKFALRQLVGQSKKRLVEGEHNLDLTYITKKIIATSFPSEGIRACYRNNISDVARYLDEKHGFQKYDGVHRYWVYNLCSEITYDEEKFHNQVKRVCIPDHNVPTVKQMIQFVSEANTWLREHDENVAVIHCKGGKGRTGTMICILALYRGIFRNAEECLAYFGGQRTDLRVDEKFQGVETASQIRYVTYYEKLINSQGRFPWMPEDWIQIKPPDVVQLKLVKIRISGINSVGNGNGTDLAITVQHGDCIPDVLYKAQVYNEYSKTAKALVESSRLSRSVSIEIDKSKYCPSEYSKENDCLEIDMKNCPNVSEDVRIKFNCSSSNVKKGYEKCAFYFWFHTAFLQERPANSFHLKMERHEIDNPHKPKKWSELGGIYPKHFSIEVFLEKPSETERY